MASDELRKVRLDKLDKFKEVNIDIYPNKFDCSHTVGESALLKEGTLDVTIAGRMMMYRDMGKLSFAMIRDHTGDMQVALQTDVIGKESCKFFLKNFDIGDIIGFSGEIFRTNKGEITLLVKEYKLLAKSLLPMPEKWHGIQDKEIRYRKRYLDLIFNKDVISTFKTRSKIIQSIRNFLCKKDALEVEDPILETVYGGAFAKPFQTHLNAMELPMFLRISLELPLKKLLVGGFNFVFEIGKVFRNEGVDRSHNPEFTLLEWYKAYADYNETMDLTEEMFGYILKEIIGDTKIEYQGTVIDFKGPWKRIKMVDALKEYADIDVSSMGVDDLLKKAKDLGLDIPKTHQTKGWLINELFEATCEDKLIQPTFVTNHPVETTPFCKVDANDPETLERFELYVNGWEIANAYSELNDPILQKEYLEKQAGDLSNGDEEANPMNFDYIEALEHGLPPNSGVGFGIDRIVMLLTNSMTIRDVLFYPVMKPEPKTGKSLENSNNKNQMTNKTQNPNTKLEMNVKMDGGISLEDAKKLVEENCDFSLMRHNFTVGASMKALCKYFGDLDNVEFWEMAGILHDIDWNKTINDVENHCGEDTIKILMEAGCSKELIDTSMSHYVETGIPKNNTIRKALAACDELTGFIVACALVRPNKLADMKAKSVTKKLKDKSFAAQVSRADMKLCEEYFDIPVSEFINILLPELKDIASDLELG